MHFVSVDVQVLCARRRMRMRAVLNIEDARGIRCTDKYAGRRSGTFSEATRTRYCRMRDASKNRHSDTYASTGHVSLYIGTHARTHAHLG
jgi:hypothetical protein